MLYYLFFFFFHWVWASSFGYPRVSTVILTSHFFLRYRPLIALFYIDNDLCMPWKSQVKSIYNWSGMNISQKGIIRETLSLFLFIEYQWKILIFYLKDDWVYLPSGQFCLVKPFGILSIPWLAKCVSKALFSKYGCQNRILLKGHEKCRPFCRRLTHKKDSIIRENLV